MVDSSFMENVARADTLEIFRTTKRVSGSALFPAHPVTSWPGVKLVSPVEEQIDRLYDELDRLIARPDALESGSDTARAIADIEAQLASLQRAELDKLQQAFEARLRMPLDAGAQLEQRLNQLMASDGDSVPDNAAAADA